MRVRVRFDSTSGASAGGVTKLLRIEDPGVDFAVLLQKIADKLEVRIEDSVTQEGWELYLEGDGGKKALVEDTSEIDDGDTLVLCRRNRLVTVKSEDEEYGNTEDPTIDSKKYENDDFADTTVAYESPKKVEVIEISTDDSGDESIKDGQKDDDREETDPGDDNGDGGNYDSGGEDDPNDGDGDGDGYIDGDGGVGVDGYKDAGGDGDDDDSNYESDDDDMSYKKKKTKIIGATGSKPSRRKPKEPPLQVHMKDEDVPAAPGKRQGGENSEDFNEAPILVSSDGGDVDRAVKDRIIKLLNAGFHNESNEHEAQNAMKLAQRLMQKHNLSQALLLKERESGGEGGEVLKGGLVRVRIVYRKTQKPSQMARWMVYLKNTIAKNFDVKSYKSVRRGKKCSVAFYGIYTNCQLAAYAFRVAVERISQMAAEHKPVPGSSVSTRSSRLSYALGIVGGITKEVNADIKREKEEREKKLERARKAASNGEAYEESDDDEGGDGSGSGSTFPGPPTNDGPAVVSSVAAQSNKSDETNENNSMVPSESASNPDAKLSGDKLARRLEEMEQEEQTALVLVNHGEKVAKEVLKDRGLCPRKARKRKPIDKNWESYKRGKEDSKEIDINQRAIRDDWTKKVKKEKM